MEKQKKVISKKVKKIIIFGSIILVLTIALIVTNKAISSKRGSVAEKGNISNMGLAASNSEGTFYNKYEDGIVKVKGSNEYQITNETAYSINVVGDDIYYLSVGDASNINIKKVKSNGTENIVIKTVRTSISKIYVQDDYIYYATNANDDGIAKLSLDGSQETVITKSEIRDFEVYDNVIYFTNKIGDLYKMNLNGTELKKVEIKASLGEFQVRNNFVYFYDEANYNLCKANLDSSEISVVSEYVNSNIFNLAKDKIYFFDAEKKKIASINYNGGNYKEIVAVSTNKTKINVVGDTIYYLDASVNESKIYQMYRVKTSGANAKTIEY